MKKSFLKYFATIFNAELSLRKYYIFYIALIPTIVLLCFYLDDQPKLKVGILFKAPENDVFQLYYINDDAPWYAEKKSISKAIKGGSQYQYLSFDLPDKGFLKNVRIDPGRNKKQGHLDISYVCLKYKSDSILLFDGDKINRFVLNECIEGDRGHFNLFSSKGVYEPSLFSKEITPETADLTYYKGKVPVFVLMPLVIALLIHLLFFTEYHSFKTSFYSFASCFFILLLLLPGLNNVVKLYKDKNREKRVLTPRPILKDMELSDFPDKYERYFNDNFGFKNILVKLGGQIKYYFFNTSSVSRATIGKEGWMYLNDPVYRHTDKGLTPNTLTESDLEQMIKTWEERKEYLENKGIKYYRTIWPEKHAIYPEYLPWQMKTHVNKQESKIDKVLNYLEEKKSGMHVLDVRKIITAHKESHLLYLKHDSHWNNRGAFIAYTQLMNTISKDIPELKPYPETDFEISSTEVKGGEISEMIGLEDTETVPLYKFKAGIEKIKEMPYLGYPPGTFVYENMAASTNLTLLVYRDSFTNALIPFLNLHFKKVVLIWFQPFTQELVEMVKPDIVVECYVSRDIR